MIQKEIYLGMPVKVVMKRHSDIRLSFFQKNFHKITTKQYIHLFINIIFIYFLVTVLVVVVLPLSLLLFCYNNKIEERRRGKS